MFFKKLSLPNSAGFKASILIFVTLFGPLSCTNLYPEEDRSGVLIVSKEQNTSWIRNFNPLLAPGSARWPAIGGIYEPMMVYNRLTAEYVPWLAEKFEWSDDSLKLSFKIRDGVQWSDGQPFHADDVVFTFDLIKKYAALDTNGIWKFVRDVNQVGDSTVEFYFQRPFVPGLGYLAHQPIVPRHLWENIKDPVTFTNPNPVGTGPFTEVVKFENQVFELAQNPRYWQSDKLKVKKLRFPAYGTNDQANLALAKGSVDWAGNFVPAIERVFVAEDPDHHTYWFPPVGGMVYLYLNTKIKPYDELEVRKALSMAIDRKKITEVAMYKYTVPAGSTGMSKVFDSWIDPELDRQSWVEFQPELAGQILDKAGYPRGPNGWRTLKSGEVWEIPLLVVSGWSDWVRSVQIIARNLRDIGIQARVQPYDFGAWFEKLQTGDFKGSISWSVESPTPHGYYRWLLSSETVQPIGAPSAGNWHRFGHPRADELLKEFERTANPQKQFELIRGVQQIFVENIPALPLFPNPAWGANNTKYFNGFPSAENPYAMLSPNAEPDFLLVLLNLTPRQ